MQAITLNLDDPTSFPSLPSTDATSKSTYTLDDFPVLASLAGVNVFWNEDAGNAETEIIRRLKRSAVEWYDRLSKAERTTLAEQSDKIGKIGRAHV